MSCNIRAIIYKRMLPVVASFFLTIGGENCFAFTISSQEPYIAPSEQRQISQEITDTLSTHTLKEIVINHRKSGSLKSFSVENKTLINQAELFRAACCNLGESFTTSPSVDVSYSDAATGARQIKLLGLSGTYVQMLTESMPAFRGAASPYSFRYVPGPWMKSISVSKGSCTVKNGYESITGQINIEYLKPQDEPGFTANAYFDSDMKLEVNAEGNIHIKEGLSTEILGHFEDRFGVHVGNDDGVRQKSKESCAYSQLSLYNSSISITDVFLFS